MYDPLDDDNNDSSNNDAVKAEGDEKEGASKEGDEDEVKEDEDNSEKTGDDEKQDAEDESEENKKEEEKVLEEEKTKEDTTPSSSPPKLTSYALFTGVDTSVATLTFDVSDLDIPLGNSAMYDVGPLCEIDVLGGVTKKVTELAVAIIPDDVDTKVELGTESDAELFEDAVSEEGEVSDNVDTTTTIEESSKPLDDDVDTAEEGGQKEATEEKVEEAQETSKKDDTADDDGDDEKNEETPASTTTTSEEGKSVVLPTCTLHLKIEYNASTRDQEVILNEKHNVLVARKALAVENLRKIAIATRRAQMAAASAGPVVKKEKPSVKPGFLNKKPKKKEPMFLIRWYDRALGPNSLIRKVYPIAKNYILFFGGVILMHYQGHQLALPPPV